MFTALKIEDYEHMHRDGTFRTGRCVRRYTVALNDKGRPVWKIDPTILYWCYGYGTSGNQRRASDWLWKKGPDGPEIETVKNKKPVSKSEAVRLLGKHWLPAAALDYLTEKVGEATPDGAFEEPVEDLAKAEGQ